MRLTKDVLKNLESSMAVYLKEGKDLVTDSLEYEASCKAKYEEIRASLKASNLPLEEIKTVKKGRKTTSEKTAYGAAKEEYETAKRGFEDYVFQNYSQINMNFKMAENGAFEQLFKYGEKAQDNAEAFTEYTAKKTFLNSVSLLAAAEKYSKEHSFGYKLGHLGEVWRLHVQKRNLRDDLMNRFGMDKKGIKNVVKFLTSDKENKYSESFHGFDQYGRKLAEEPVVEIDEALGEEKEDIFEFSPNHDHSKNRDEVFQGTTWNKCRLHISVEDEEADYEIAEFQGARIDNNAPEIEAELY